MVSLDTDNNKVNESELNVPELPSGGILMFDLKFLDSRDPTLRTFRGVLADVSAKGQSFEA